MSQENKKWYDHKGLVIFLLIIFFPVGLYALWKSSSFTNGWKIGLTAFIGIMFIISLIPDNENQREQETAVESNQTENPEKEVKQIKTKSVQELFISRKNHLFFNEFVNPGNDAQKALFLDKTKAFTKSFLDSINHSFVEWEGEIKSINLGFKESDLELLKHMSPNQVIEKYPNGRPLDIWIIIAEEKKNNASLIISAWQVQNKQFKGGVLPSDPIYNKILNLKEGEKVKFSAKVLDVKESKMENLAIVEQSIFFDVELTAIEQIGQQSSTRISSEKQPVQKTTPTYHQPQLIDRKTLFEEDIHSIPAGQLWKIRTIKASPWGFIMWVNGQEYQYEYDNAKGGWTSKNGSKELPDEFTAGTTVAWTGFQSDGAGYIVMDVYSKN